VWNDRAGGSDRGAADRVGGAGPVLDERQRAGVAAGSRSTPSRMGLRAGSTCSCWAARWAVASRSPSTWGRRASRSCCNCTGLQSGAELAGAVTATIGGVNAPVEYAGAVSGYTGLDQVNLRVPRSLMGRGEVNIVLTADGRTSNTVTVNIK